MRSKQACHIRSALQARLIAILYRHIPATVLGTLIVFSINLAYHGIAPASTALRWWIALGAAFVLGRTALYLIHRRGPDLTCPLTWRNLHAATTLCNAAAWSVYLSAVVSLDSPEPLVIAAVSVAGVVGGGLATTCASIVSFSCFTAPLALALPLLLMPVEGRFEYALTAQWLTWFSFMLLSGHRVHHALAHAETTRLEKESLVEKLEQLSERDPLTNLYNRRRFLSRLAQAWTDAGQHGGEVGLLVADIDYFKQYNDAAGHGAGDACLRAVAEQLDALCAEQPEETLLARYGGEEFVVLMPDTCAQQATKLAQALRAQLERCAFPHPHSTVAAHITMSVGVATLTPEPASEPLALFRAADLALYRAKSNGRNCVVLAPSDATDPPSATGSLGQLGNC